MEKKVKLQELLRTKSIRQVSIEAGVNYQTFYNQLRYFGFSKPTRQKLMDTYDFVEEDLLNDYPVAGADRENQKYSYNKGNYMQRDETGKHVF